MGVSTQHGNRKIVQVRTPPCLPEFIVRCFPAHCCFPVQSPKKPNVSGWPSAGSFPLCYWPGLGEPATSDPCPGGAQPSSSDPLSPVLLPGPDRDSQTARHSLAQSSGPSPASSQPSAGPTMVEAFWSRARGRPALHSGSSQAPPAPPFRDEGQAHSEPTVPRPWEAGIWQVRNQCQKGQGACPSKIRKPDNRRSPEAHGGHCYPTWLCLLRQDSVSISLKCGRICSSLTDDDTDPVMAHVSPMLSTE